MAAISAAASQAVLRANEWELADPGVFAGAHAVFDPGVDPVGGIDVGQVGAPAPQVSGQVGNPQRVPPPVFGLEQGELGAGMGALTAGEDAHGGRPAVELVTAGTLAQQPGQLCHVGFFHPALAVAAAAVSARVAGAALADLAAVTDRALPGLHGHQPERGALTFTQLPAHGVDELVAGPGGEGIQPLDQPVAGAGTVAGHHQPPPVGRRQRGDRRRQNLQVIGHGIGPGAALAQRLGRVVAVGQQRVVPESL